MRFGSVCSGIEAASVAFGPLGWEAAWFSEIEPFPTALLAHHYPDVPNLGDMTLLPELVLLGHAEAPDVLCGGTPCQAFSVAGLRNSLDDARGNLSLTFCELANAIDMSRAHDNLDPCIVFWENVPGVLSTKDNAFGCFLAGLAGEDDPLLPPGDKWTNAGVVLGPKRTVAWRILDAQYFGVAQRRRRVFVVASAREGFDPAAVLFEFDGVRRDTAPSREAGQRVANALTDRADRGGTNSEGQRLIAHSPEIARCIATREGRSPDFETTTVTHSLRGEGFDASEDGTGRGTPLVPVALPINTQIATRHNCLGEGTGFGIGDATDPAFTLTKGHSHAVAASGLTAMQVRRLTPVECERLQGFPDGTANALLTPNGGRGGIGVGAVDFHPTQDPISSTEVCHSIGTNNNATAAVMAEYYSHDYCHDRVYSADGISPALNCSQDHAIRTAMQVRRLTPVECERLQGFPDGYTAIPWRNKPADQCPDGPRHKALGNSWAVPCVAWVCQRINKHLYQDLV